jgi:hypothetical protein
LDETEDMEQILQMLKAMREDRKADQEKVDAD